MNIDLLLEDVHLPSCVMAGYSGDARFECQNEKARIKKQILELIVEARIEEANTLLTVLETTHPDFRLKQIQLRIIELKSTQPKTEVSEGGGEE